MNLTPEQVDKLFEMVSKLGELVGQGSEYVWPVIMRQTILIDGVLQVVGSLLLTVLAMYMMYQLYRRWQKFQQEYPRLSDRPEETMALFGLGAFALAIVILIAFFDGFMDGVTTLLNPGYYALEVLFRLLRG